MGAPVKELVVELADGIRTIFTTQGDIKTGTLKVFLNGLVDIQITKLPGRQFEFNNGPPLDGDAVSAYYVKL